MKKLYFRTLMLLLALTWVVPKVHAQEYTFSLNVPSDWHSTFSAPGGLYRQAAVADDAFFVAPAYAGDGSEFIVASGISYSQGYRIDSSNGAKEFSYGSWTDPDGYTGSYYCAGPGIASDTYGNLYMKARRATSSAGFYNNAEAVIVYTTRPNPSASNIGIKSVLNITSVGARTDRMSAYGNCMSGTGYLWFAPNSKQLVRVTVNSGSVNATNSTFSTPNSSGTVGATNGAIVSQYSANEVLYDEGNATLYKGTISGSTITWTSLGVTNKGSGATMFEFGGKEILVYASATNAITVRNVTDGVDIKTDSPWGTSVSTNSATYFSINAKVNSDNTAYIYIYTPGVGAARYTLTATPQEAPITSGTATLIKEEDMDEPDINKPGRQNMIVSWQPNPAWTTQPTEYKVQFRRYCLDPATGNVAITGTWVDLVNGSNAVDTDPSDCTIVHNNVCYWKNGNVNYEVRFAYRVIPYWDGLAGATSEEIINDRNPEFIPIAPNWLYLFGESSYDGLCMTQLYWEYPGYGLRPDSYDIIRDDVAVNGDDHVAAFVYVDYDAKAGHTHAYQIKTHYNGLDESKYAVSATRSTTIGSRDWSKPKYKITEVYNFALYNGEYELDASSNAAGNFLVPDCYAQASFYNGRWYVAQMYDDKVDRRLHDTSNSMYVSGNSWSTYVDECVSKGSVASVLVFDADDQSQAYGKMKGGKKLPIDLRVYSNRGVGIDDAGNIFVRGISSPTTTVTSNGYRYTHEFEYPMTYGVIYKNNGNDTYTQYSVDFASAGINFSELSQTQGGPVDGRTDYFSMSGDVFSSEGAYLYLAPTQTKAAYVIKLTASGSTINVEKVGVYFEHGVNQDTRYGEKPYKAGIENYAFPVKCEGREGQFIHNIRSNVYRNLKIDNSGTTTYSETLSAGYNWITLASAPYSYNVSGVEGYAPATPNVNAEGRMYDVRSRVNNAGGCTLEFNGELFVITPVCQYSINSGSFYVGRGYRKTVSIDQATGTATRVGPAEADLCNIVPVASVFQQDEATAAFINSNGMWIHAEVADITKEAAQGLDADTDKNGVADYAYIYIYSPGKRFAKYRLEPDGLFPPSPSELEIVPEYEREYVAGEHNPGGELVGYDAVVTWEPMEYEYNVPNSAGVKEGNYSVYSYSVTLCYADGTPVLDDNGQPLTVEIPVYDAGSGTSADNVVLDADGKIVNYTHTFPGVDLYDASGNAITYVSQVVVNYKGEDGTIAAGEVKNSIETEAEGSNDYIAEAPEGTVNIGKTEEWADWDADTEKDEDDGYWNVYRIELEPTNPQWDNVEDVQPVSYYTIQVSSDDSDTNDATLGNKNVCDFYLYDPDSDTATEGVQNVTGLEPDAQGYVHVTSCQIPGEYQFNPDDEYPDIYWVEKDYTGATGDGGEGNAPLDDGKINPAEWTYRVDAEYAAENENLRKTETGTMEKSNKVPTEVEVIGVENSYRVYPNPATSVVNVRSGNAINNVAIYSMAGTEVKSVYANGVNHIAIPVDDLAEGYYILKVNGKNPVKVLVK